MLTSTPYAPSSKGINRYVASAWGCVLSAIPANPLMILRADRERPGRSARRPASARTPSRARAGRSDHLGCRPRCPAHGPDCGLRSSVLPGSLPIAFTDLGFILGWQQQLTEPLP